MYVVCNSPPVTEHRTVPAALQRFTPVQRCELGRPTRRKDQGQHLAGLRERQAPGTVGSSRIREPGRTLSLRDVTQVFRGARIHEPQEGWRVLLAAGQAHLEPPRRPPLGPWHRLRDSGRDPATLGLCPGFPKAGAAPGSQAATPGAVPPTPSPAGGARGPDPGGRGRPRAGRGG